MGIYCFIRLFIPTVKAVGGQDKMWEEQNPSKKKGTQEKSEHSPAPFPGFVVFATLAAPHWPGDTLTRCLEASAVGGAAAAAQHQPQEMCHSPEAACAAGPPVTEKSEAANHYEHTMKRMVDDN